ncbi:MAG TPA: hypothetical protein VE172_07700 [Stackebrandtia sp.]|jgi:hypothetical protein|uniref:hypothetical protein n=1 Tax=Stackebrandtia sp. TaxID=2023065 RepID=UPI002D703696|nr:hypothetical protein [Stackebrandtia sp.]HZE38683.1 hypothetical protein [Stackebrandtia sp.]
MSHPYHQPTPPNPYGWQQPGQQQPPSTAPAYIAAALFISCSVVTFVVAQLNASGHRGGTVAALVFAVFSEDINGNLDFAISATFTVAFTVLSLSVVLLFRIGFVRWILALIGAITALYYLIGVGWLLVHHVNGLALLLSLFAFLVWMAAVVFVLLPATGAAMRRRT